MRSIILLVAFIAILLVAIMLASCVRIPVPGGQSIQQLGGDLAADYQADPTTGKLTSVTVVSEMHQSFKVGAETLGKFLDTLTMAHLTKNIMLAQETTKRMADAGLTKAEIARIDAQAQRDAAAFGAGLAPPGYTPIPVAPAP